MFCQFYFQREISEVPLPMGVKFCTVVSNRPCFIMPFYNFGEPSPPKNRGQKHAKFGLISDDFRVWRQISPELDKDIQNRTFTFCTAIPSAMGEKVW